LEHAVNSSIVVTMPDGEFSGVALRGGMADSLTREGVADGIAEPGAAARGWNLQDIAVK
jgi:hypothetical protein